MPCNHQPFHQKPHTTWREFDSGKYIIPTRDCVNSTKVVQFCGLGNTQEYLRKSLLSGTRPVRTASYTALSNPVVWTFARRSP